MKIVNLTNRIIEYSFYLLLLLTPLAFTNNTSELFEFNKMWITFGFTILIVGAWICKMIAKKQFSLQRTPLDIPILLFLLSQIISTIFSLDGGLLSTMSYILLYYAFVSNLAETKMVKRLLLVGLISGAIVALWGLPSHFGYDPTCLLFRKTFDVSCWTVDFQPKLRIFSTIGQPNWLAAYLAILTPIALAMAISNLKSQISIKFSKQNLITSGYFLLAFIFVLDLLFTKSQSGFLGIVAALLVFTGIPIYQQYKTGKNKNIKLLIASLLIFILTVFFVGSPIDRLNVFTYQGITSKLAKRNVSKSNVSTAIPALELNITGSGKIRSIVWKGAIDVWKHYPLFGSGVETFAYSYYKYRPVEHNLTSEWNYLYNKAHNQYLNFLSTTGAFGLLTYLSMIGLFLFVGIKGVARLEGVPSSDRRRNEVKGEDVGRDEGATGPRSSLFLFSPATQASLSPTFLDFQSLSSTFSFS